MTRATLFFVFSAFLATAADGREVIDLGSLKVEGAARGPDVRLIDTARLDATTAETLALSELTDIERRLLGEGTKRAETRTTRRTKENRR